MSGATASLAAAAPEVLWLDDPDRPAPLDPFAGSTRADVVVVGGGYTGLWTALRTRERYPDSDVVLVDAGECGWQASGRNGGFAETSLTHGFFNGLRRWPEELVQLNRLGRENLAAIEESIRTHAIDCHFERTGQLSVATRPHEADELAEAAAVMAQFGHQVSLLDRVQTRAVVDSPTYYAGMLDDGCALVEPARLAWGLRAACLAAGVRIFEQTTVRDLRARRTHVEVITDAGLLLADRVALATNAFPPLLRRLRLMTSPSPTRWPTLAP